MPVFQVTPLANNHAQLAAALAAKTSKGGADSYALPSEAGWLVAYKGTTIELSNLLGVTGQPPGEKSPIGPTLVVAITSYYGRAGTDLWEWLKTRFESAA